LSEKKKAAEREATKYDIDKKDLAKALNIQNLGTTPRFLPLSQRKLLITESLRTLVLIFRRLTTLRLRLLHREKKEGRDCFGLKES